jgi:hypothetical protein
VGHVWVVRDVPAPEEVEPLLERAAFELRRDRVHPIVRHARQHAHGGVHPQLLRHRVDHGERQRVVVLREEMLAGVGEVVDRGRAAGAAADGVVIDRGLDPTLSLQLQELLAHGLAGQSEQRGELGDGGGAALFQRHDDGAAAVGQLFERENRESPSAQQ